MKPERITFTTEINSFRTLLASYSIQKEAFSIQGVVIRPQQPLIFVVPPHQPLQVFDTSLYSSHWEEEMFDLSFRTQHPNALTDY